MCHVNEDHQAEDVGQDCLPDLDEWNAFLEGEVAAMCGLKPNDNPYPYPSKHWVQWNNGFCHESPRRDEAEEDAELRRSYHETFLNELKTCGAWKWIKPPTKEETRGMGQ